MASTSIFLLKIYRAVLTCHDVDSISIFPGFTIFTSDVEWRLGSITEVNGSPRGSDIMSNTSIGPHPPRSLTHPPLTHLPLRISVPASHLSQLVRCSFEIPTSHVWQSSSILSCNPASVPPVSVLCRPLQGVEGGLLSGWKVPFRVFSVFVFFWYRIVQYWDVQLTLGIARTLWSPLELHISRHCIHRSLAHPFDC